MIGSNVLANIGEAMDQWALTALGVIGFTALIVGMIAYSVGYSHGKRRRAQMDRPGFPVIPGERLQKDVNTRSKADRQD